jgi:hypothetical protein
MTAWASFAEADKPSEQTPAEPEAERPPAAVEDMAVGKLRLWLRGVFGDGTQRRPRGE